MADNHQDDATARNRNSTVSSTDSADTLLPTDPNAAPVPDLPTRSDHPVSDRPLSLNSHYTLPSSISGGTISDLTADSSTPVNTSQSLGSEYAGTRFGVEKTDSSKLEQHTSSSSSSSRVAVTPQSPKSVTFNADGAVANPSTAKSEKTPFELSKSSTTSAIGTISNEPRTLFPQRSQDSFPSKELWNLPEYTKASADQPVAGTGETRPLLADTSAIGSTNRGQSSTTSGPENPPNRQDVRRTIFRWAAFGFFVGMAITLIFILPMYHAFFHGSKTNETKITTTTFHPGALTMVNNLTEANTNALPYTSGSDNMEGETDTLHSDNSTTTTTDILIANISTI